jgi:hypothetical protein
MNYSPEMEVSYKTVNGVLLKFSKPRGIPNLGDKVAAIAQPIAGAIDKVAGTKITGCGGCKKMRERLNAGMSIQEAARMRILDFALQKIVKQKKNILSTVDARLKMKVK